MKVTTFSAFCQLCQAETTHQWIPGITAEGIGECQGCLDRYRPVSPELAAYLSRQISMIPIGVTLRIRYLLNDDRLHPKYGYTFVRIVSIEGEAKWTPHGSTGGSVGNPLFTLEPAVGLDFPFESPYFLWTEFDWMVVDDEGIPLFYEPWYLPLEGYDNFPVY